VKIRTCLPTPWSWPDRHTSLSAVHADFDFSVQMNSRLSTRTGSSIYSKVAMNRHETETIILTVHCWNSTSPL
jgi:hypothetical protein